MKGSNDDLFVFLFFSSFVRIVLPQNFRELSLFLPLFTGIVILLKKQWPLKNVAKYKLKSSQIFLLLFFFLVGYQVFHGMQLPSLLRFYSVNTGFLGRWSLFSNMFLFGVLYTSFRPSYLHYLLSKMREFYACVLTISFMMLLFHINSLPLFNTFTWSIVVENASSRKMIIAGTASIFLVTSEIATGKFCFKKILLSTFLLIIVFMSGSRTAFLSFFIIIFFAYAIRKGLLARSIGMMILIGGVGIALFLSPVILYIPAKYQRLFIIFPSEFYTGKLHELSTSSAANSSSFRYNMWKKASEAILENPLTGNGIGVPQGNYNLKAEGLGAFNNIDSKTLVEDFMATGSLHNAFITIAYVFGLPAAFFFISFLITLLMSIYKMSQLADNEHKPYFVFLTLIILNFIIQAFISDIHNSQEFYALTAIAMKLVYTIDYKNTQFTFSTLGT